MARSIYARMEVLPSGHRKDSQQIQNEMLEVEDGWLSSKMHGSEDPKVGCKRKFVSEV